MRKSWTHCLQNEVVSFDQLLYAWPGFEDNKVMKKVKITLSLKHNKYRILFVTTEMFITPVWSLQTSWNTLTSGIFALM